MAALNQASLLVLFFQQYLLTLGLCVTFGNSPESTFYHSYYIHCVIGDL